VIEPIDGPGSGEVKKLHVSKFDKSPGFSLDPDPGGIYTGNSPAIYRWVSRAKKFCSSAGNGWRIISRLYETGVDCSFMPALKALGLFSHRSPRDEVKSITREKFDPASLFAIDGQ
jgi:hypothetical protein